MQRGDRSGIPGAVRASCGLGTADDKCFQLGHFEQLVDQPAHVLDIVAQRRGEVAVGDHVDLGAQDRQRRA